MFCSRFPVATHADEARLGPATGSTSPSSPRLAVGYCTDDLEKAKVAGFDYVELGVRNFVRLIRPRTYERQSWWSDKPMVHAVRRVAPPAVQPGDPGYGPAQRAVDALFSDWTPREAEPHEEDVEVYSNCDEVGVLLNGRSLGSKPLSPDAAARTWKVAYEPGTLRAQGRNKGQVVATHELRSAGLGKKIALAADRHGVTVDRDDVLYITASVVDEKGVGNPWADDLIGFELSGPGAIAAVDSADLRSHEPSRPASAGPQGPLRRHPQGHGPRQAHAPCRGWRAVRRHADDRRARSLARHEWPPRSTN